MTAAQCLAASVFIPGSVAHGIARHECIEWEDLEDGLMAMVNVQNPQGIVRIGVHMEKRGDAAFTAAGIDPPHFLACSYSRTTRLLASGHVYSD